MTKNPSESKIANAGSKAKAISTGMRTAAAFVKGATTAIPTLTFIKRNPETYGLDKNENFDCGWSAILFASGTTATVTMKALIGRSVPLKVAYVRHYPGHDCFGHLLTILPIASDSNNIALLRGDLDNFDGVPSDDGIFGNFNDKTASISYPLPKGQTAFLSNTPILMAHNLN